MAKIVVIVAGLSFLLCTWCVYPVKVAETICENDDVCCPSEEANNPKTPLVCCSYL